MSAALFDLGRNGGTQSDPALEPSEVGGHTLLQRRLSLYGKALVVQSILYWLIYAIIWGPTVGFKRSLGYIASWDVLLLTAIYSLYWIVARGKPRATSVLLATDVVGSLAIGIDSRSLNRGAREDPCTAIEELASRCSAFRRRRDKRSAMYPASRECQAGRSAITSRYG